MTPRDANAGRTPDMRCLECHGALHTIVDCPYQLPPKTRNRFVSLVGIAERELSSDPTGPTLAVVVRELQEMVERLGLNDWLRRNRSLADRFDCVVAAWKETRA